MLQKATIVFVLLCLAGGIYEISLRGSSIIGDDEKVLRVGAEGWQITEFKLHEHVERFRREHDVRVELFQLPVGYETNLMFQAATGDISYDLILSTSNSTLEAQVERGLALPLDDLISKEFKDRVIPGFLNGCKVDGKIYGIPFLGEVAIINYRKDLFKEARIAGPPQTWKQFEEDAIKLKKMLDGSDRYALSLCIEQGAFFVQNTYIPLLRSLSKRPGSAIVNEDGHLDIYSPASREVFRIVKRWYKMGLIDPACMMGYGTSDDFKSGITAIFPHWQSRGLWADMNEKLKGKIGFVKSPDADRVGSLICVYAGMIIKQSKMHAEAMQFLQEAICGYGQADIIKAGKMPVTYDSYKKGTVPEWMIPISKTLENAYIAPEPIYGREVSTRISVALHKYLKSDSDDPDPFLRDVAQELEKRVYNVKD